MENKDLPLENFSPFWEREEGSYWDTPEGKEEARVQLQEIEAETDSQDPVLDWMHGVQFESSSQGRKRKRRRRSKIVRLLQFNGDREANVFRSWTGEDRNDDGRCPWDQWAQQIFDEGRIAQLSAQGQPEDRLRERVVELLESRRRF